MDLSLVSFIGIILLMGIVKKNAIMMVDFALDAEREEKLSPEEAIYKACVIRFRPIMMTTMAAFWAAIPLASAWATAPNCAVRWASPSSAGCCFPRSSPSTPRRSSIWPLNICGNGSESGAMAVWVNSRRQDERAKSFPLKPHAEVREHTAAIFR